MVLDADWNEQAELQLRAVRQMMRDLVGPHGGPEDELGFLVESELKDGKIVLNVHNGSGAAGGEVRRSERGRYYVDGILVEHIDDPGPLHDVKTGVVPSDLGDKVMLVYLEVWERHVTWIEESKEFQRRSMREVALGGPDTASRSEVRWAVKTMLTDRPPNPTPSRNPRPRPTPAELGEVLKNLLPPRGMLAASLTTEDIGAGDPCRDTAQPRYRGPENRLYRVEIHAADDPADPDSLPTFKWSRENGSVVYAIVNDQKLFSGKELAVKVAGLGRDDRYHLRRGDIVELVTETLDRAGDAGPLLEVKEVDADTNTVKLRSFAGVELNLSGAGWALLRRWDQPHEPRRETGAPAKMRDGAIVIDGSDNFVLEDGIVVSFERPPELSGGVEPYRFRAGDYWLIPARTIPGDVEWPRAKNESGPGVLEPPHGVERHIAPLALVDADPSGQAQVIDLRRRFRGLAGDT